MNGVDDLMNDNNQIVVFMKKDIKSDKIWENHPTLLFSICTVIFVLIFLSLIFIISNGVILTITLVGIAALYIYWFFKNNDKRNVTKNGAFVLKDNVLYYVELGYDVNYQVLGTPVDIVLGGVKFAHDSAVADQVIVGEERIKEARKHAETFVEALNKVLNNNTGKLVPEGIRTYCIMNDVKLENVSENEFTVSYWNKFTNGNRVEQKYRNIYDGLIEYLQNK